MAQPMPSAPSLDGASEGDRRPHHPCRHAGLASAGHAFAVPFGENTRYDLILDEGDELYRVQCKTGRLRDGAIRFATCSSYAHHRNPGATQRPYFGEVDYFAVYCPENGGVYLIPIADIPSRRMATLRVDAPRNNQWRFVRLAANYELATVDTTITCAVVPYPRRGLEPG